jgi:acylphosphatase
MMPGPKRVTARFGFFGFCCHGTRFLDALRSPIVDNSKRLTEFHRRDRRLSRKMRVVHHVVVRGRVQGVGFRAWAEITALELGLEGWVRNRRDGSVEVVLAGTEDVVAAMVELCRKGPPGARVDALAQRAAGAVDLAFRRPGELFSVLATA